MTRIILLVPRKSFKSPSAGG